jgi:hypothetical protein
VFVDQGMNTANNIYNYRVLAYDSNKVFMDTSAIASSVRLELKPLYQEVELTWTADVPWSNNSPRYPMHRIYRGTNTNSKTIKDFDFTLIDSVDVTKKKFYYLDSGQYQTTPLDRTKEYCYAVMTRGSYGNKKLVPDSLINFSEITCTIPDNKTKPCKPVLIPVDYCKNWKDCFEIGSSPPATNIVKWKVDSDCATEIKGYNVYAANSKGDTFTKIAELVKETFFEHSNLQTYAQCYKVSAVSRAGVESELSDQFCFENCPYYELPNVFTPNGDGCNDLFSAYNVNNYPPGEVGEPGFKPWPCGHKFVLPGTLILDTAKNGKLDTAHYENIKSKCARFVLAVNFTVYNRWGREVYHYSYDLNLASEDGGGSTPNPLYINWDGRDSSGRELDPGVYFYGCNVTFAAADPKKRNANLKGWVQIIR